MPSRPVAALAAVAMAALVSCGKPPVAEVYPQVAEYDGRLIEAVEFVDTEPFAPDTLEALTETEATRCELIPTILPFCVPGTDWGLRERRLEMRTVGDDLARMMALYRQKGYFGTVVIPEIEEMEEEEDAIRVRFVVRRGDGIVMDSVVVEGTEGIADPDSLESELPLQPGELLDLGEFVASADTVVEALRERGHAYAEVLRNYAVDTIQDRATVWLLAVPGPRVEVDSVRIDGLSQLDRRDVRRQLTFEEGDLLRRRELGESQRNLYELELVQFATVAVAPDTLQRTPGDSTTATVRISIAEAPEHVVEARAGFGTVECGRVRGEWSDRHVLGGARKLTVTGSVSRLGLGDPVSGLENGVCSQGRDTLLATELDYRLAADFSQPYFFSPRNELAATAFTERQSEPRLFQRTASGARFSLSRRLRPRERITGALDVEYRTTEGAPVLYCLELRACSPSDVARFQRGLWRNGLSATWIRDRSNTPLNPTDGHLLRADALWSTAFLGSDFDFLRTAVEGAIYRSVGSGWVVAGSLRLGSFITRASLGPRDFVPPEERFFAGGATSVRGYDRFELGPGVYLYQEDVSDPDTLPVSDSLSVDFFPTGGTSLAVASVETRFPSPWLRDLLRLAVFVDAGTVGLDPVWKLDSQWRVTPGVGLRIGTPVGPARVDLAYNPYPAPRAPLYVVDAETRALVRVAESFQDPPPPFLDRFQLHIAVGQPF